MLINNPNRNIRLIDLLDMTQIDFNYNDLYNVVGDWLKSEKIYLVNENLFDDFIEMFCDRFYQRELNFDTFLDCKLKIRNTLRKYREKAKRMYQASLIEINPLNTYEHLTDNNGNTTGDSVTNSKYKGVDVVSSNHTDKVKNSGSDSVDSWHLHSDTPSDSQNLTDLKGSNPNYVTDVTNDHNKTTHGQVTDTTGNSSTNSNTENNSDTKNDYSEDRIFHELAKGYDGHPGDLLNKYVNLNLDTINFYLDMIEKECIFSNILY